jgi:lysozyme
MKPSKTCFDLIKSFEGLFLNAYPDPKTGGEPITIGFGSTMYQNGKKVKMGDTITEAEALKLLEWEITNKANAISLNVNQNQFDALVSFAFNLGLGNFNSSTLKKKIFKNPNDPTIRNEFMRWVSPGSSVEKGLRRRRKAEADLYFS